MTTLAEDLARDRRIIILRALVEPNGMMLNETIIKAMVNRFGHNVGRDVVRGDLCWLEEQRLVRVEKLDTERGEFWVAHLTNDGEEVAQGRKHPGVARRAD